MVVASMPRQAPHGSDELAAADDAPRSEHNGTVPVLHATNPEMPFWGKGDWNSFFLLSFDNLSALISILAGLLSIPHILPVPDDVKDSSTAARQSKFHGPRLTFARRYVSEYEHMIYRKMLPGVGFSLLFGNLWYAWMARKLAGYDGRTNVTAHPYGVNTPAGLLMTFNVVFKLVEIYMLEEYYKHAQAGRPPLGANEVADNIWKGATAACFFVGLVEIAGAWFGPLLVRHVPLAALLTPIAAIGFVWLAMAPFFQGVVSEPLVGMPAFLVAMIGFYGTKSGAFCVGGFRVPAAVVVVAVGTILYWSNLCHYNKNGSFDEYGQQPLTVNDPRGCGSNANHREDVDDAVDRLWENKLTVGLGLSRWKDIDKFVGLLVPIPVAISSVIETLEDWQMGKIAGDAYNMREMMVVDGLGTCIGALFGSFLPTTVYLGHPIHKKYGATAGYSILNAVVFFTVLNAGIYPLIEAVIPYACVAPILMVVGLTVAANALDVSPRRHTVAIFIGLFCVLADYIQVEFGLTTAFGAEVVTRGVFSAGTAGGIMNALVLTAIVCDLIDREFLRAAVFCFIACWFSMFGLMHSNNLQGHSIGADHRAGRGELTWAERARGNVGWRFAICYGAFSVLLVAAHAGQKAGLVEPPVEEATHQQALEESVAEFEESLSKDSRVSVKKDDGEA